MPTHVSDLEIFDPSYLGARHWKIHITIPIITETFPVIKPPTVFLLNLADLQYFKVNDNRVLRHWFAVHFNTVNFGWLQRFCCTFQNRNLKKNLPCCQNQDLQTWMSQTFCGCYSVLSLYNIWQHSCLHRAKAMK